MCYLALQVVGENVEASGAVKEILGAAAEKAAQANATKVLCGIAQQNFCCNGNHCVKQERPACRFVIPCQEHSWSHQILNLSKGLLHDISPSAVQDEIIKSVTGDGTFPRTMWRP